MSKKIFVLLKYRYNNNNFCILFLKIKGGIKDFEFEEIEIEDTSYIYDISDIEIILYVSLMNKFNLKHIIYIAKNIYLIL